jgi:hypothetical protein
MTTGALIFAFNNAEIDYVTMAAWNASNIQRHLGIPTSLVTDCIDPDLKDTYDKFDRVIVVEKPRAGTRHFEDIGATVDWYNTNRMDAYTLTPYDQTLIIDADFVVANDVLNTLPNLMNNGLGEDRGLQTLHQQVLLNPMGK